MKKQNVMKTIRIALVCVFATVFVVSAVMLINTLIDYRVASEKYDQVHKEFMDIVQNPGGSSDQNPSNDIWTRGPEGEVETPPITQDTTPPPVDDPMTPEDPDQPVVTTPVETQPPAPVYSERFLSACEFINKLKETNPEVVGYIYVEIDPADESKNISYPLVRSKDNDYYIDHAYDNSSLKAGAIFLDYRNSTTLQKNIVSLVYGHNMNNGAMFHNLKYLKQHQYFDNATITVYTLDGIYTYKPFSIYNTMADSGYNHMYFNSNEQYIEFLTNIKKSSLLSSDIEVYNTDRIITLSTCLNTSRDARMAVHGLLVGISQ